MAEQLVLRDNPSRLGVLPRGVSDLLQRSPKAGEYIAGRGLLGQHILAVARIPDVLERFGYQMIAADSSVRDVVVEEETFYTESPLHIPQLMTGWDLTWKDGEDSVSRVTVALVNARKGGIYFARAVPELPTNQDVASALTHFGDEYGFVTEAGMIVRQDRLRTFGRQMQEMLGAAKVEKGQTVILQSPYLGFQA